MKVVIIGNGMVGYKFCEKLIAHSKANQFELTVFGEEIRPAYDRVHLSEYFAGKSAEDLINGSAPIGTGTIISPFTSEIRLLKLNRIQKQFISHLGIVESYDYLDTCHRFFCICSTNSWC